MHALTAWDLKFQVCHRYTFTPATLREVHIATEDCTQLISKTFEQIVYFSTSAASYQTNLNYKNKCQLLVNSFKFRSELCGKGKFKINRN
jgi:hypothetical protein